MTRALVASSFTPALGTGRGLRTVGVLRALAAHGPVEVLFVPFGPGEPAPSLVEDERITLRPLVPSRGVRRALAVLDGVVRERMPLDLARAVSAELRDAIEQAARPGDRVLADGPTAAGTLLPLARRRPCTYVAYNLETSFRATPALERFERRVLETFAESWMCTATDAEGARRLAPAVRGLRVVPNVVEVPQAPAPPPAGTQRVLMVADFRYAPNAEAVRWLVGDVMPRVWAQLPQARLDLAGRELPAGLAADGRVRELGFVEDLPAAYAAVDAVVVPLLRGGGSPLKFIEGLSYGRPVVATAHAAALLEDGRAGTHFLAAEGAEALAQALVAVLRDGAPGVGDAGRELVRRHLSVEALVGAVAP